MYKVVLKIIGILFCTLVLPPFIKNGLFVDGLFYGTLSKNLYLGKGQILMPFFSETLAPEFFGHPPLFFLIESVFFDLFGNQIWIEKLFGFIVFLLVLLFLVKLWKLNFDKKSYSRTWILPVFFFILAEHNYRSYANNLLECLVTLFTLASIYYYLVFEKTNKLIFVALGSLFVVLGVYTKGPIALFPLALWFGLFLLRGDFKKHILRTLKALLLVVTLFIIPVLLVDDLYVYWKEYLKLQLLPVADNSFNNNRVSSRLYIVYILFKDNIIPIVIIALLFGLKKINRKVINDSNVKLAVFIGLSASLPIVISLKQAGYYIIPSLPYFSIVFGLLVQTFYLKLDTAALLKLNKVFSVLLLVSLIVPIISYGKTSGRNRAIDKDALIIKKQVGDQKTIGYLYKDKLRFLIPGTFYRYHEISLDTNIQVKHQYLISDKSILPDTTLYKKVPVTLEKLNLYKHE